MSKQLENPIVTRRALPTQIKPAAWVACLLLTTVVGSPATANEPVVTHNESGAVALGAKVSQAAFTCDIEGLRSLRKTAQADLKAGKVVQAAARFDGYNCNLNTISLSLSGPGCSVITPTFCIRQGAINGVTGWL